MKTLAVKLPGRKSGYACKIFINGSHVATVADPSSSSREAALAAASYWERKYKKILLTKNVSN